MSRILPLCTLFCTVLGLATAVSAEEPVTFRYQMSESDNLIYRSTIKTHQAQTIAQQKIVTDLTQKDVALYTFNKVDEEGNFHVTTENKQLMVDVTIGPLGKYKFDSRELEHEKGSTLGAALTPLYESLSGAYANVVHSPLGEVKKVTGLTELLKEALKDNPIASQFVAGGTDEGIQQAYKDRFVVFSEKPVAVDETWDVEYELPIPKIGKGKGKKVYTYLGNENIDGKKVAKIKVDNELNFEIDIDMGEATVTGSLSTVKSSGIVHFDPRLGQVVYKKTSHSFSGNLNVTAGGNTFPIQTEQSQEVTIELLDKLPE